MKNSTKYLALDEIAPAIPAVPPSKTGKNVWRLDLEHIEPHTGRLLKRTDVPLEEVGLSTNAFDDGNLLYSKLRPYLNKVYEPNAKGFATSELVPLRPDPSVIDRSYLAHYMRSQKFVSFASNAVAGAKMPRLSPDALRLHKVPVPPLPEQRRIAATLGHVQALRQKHAYTQQLARDLVPAIFSEMFGDSFTNPKGFSLERMDMLVETDRGRSRHRPRDERSLYDGPYPFIQTGDIARSDGVLKTWTQTYSEKGLAQSRMWPKGTVVTTIAANIGKTAILDFDACFPDSVVGFVPGKRIRPGYLRTFLAIIAPRLEELAPQAAQKNINLEIIRKIKVPVPPLELQDAFEERLKQCISLSVRLNLRSENLKTLADSIAAEYF